MVLVLCEMQSVSSGIWTRVAVSISYDDNHYTTGTTKSKWTMPIAPLFPYTTGTSTNLSIIDIKRIF